MLAKDKEAQDALKQSEEKFKDIIKNAPIAIYEIDFDGSKIRAVNSAVSHWLGYSEEEIFAMNPLNLLGEESKKKFQEIVKEALNGNKTLYSSEFEVKAKNGQSIWGLFHAKINFKNGKPDTVVVFAQDITERKKADEAIRQSEKKLQNIINAMDDGIVLLGLDGKVIDCNQATLKQFKMKREEVIGKVIMEFMFSQNKEDFIKETQDVLRKTGKAIVETHLQRKNDSPISVEVSLTRFIGENNSPIGLLGVARDITERKKTEEALKESEQLYRTLFENNDDGFMLIEPVYDEHGDACDIRFLKLNAAYERQTGAKAADVLGRKASEVVPQLEPEIISLSGKVAKTGKSTRSEVYDKYSNKWYDSQYVPFAKGQVGILFRDITVRKKTEESLKESETKYEQLVDKLPEMVFEINNKGRVVFANLRAMEITGYSIEEFGNDFDANRLVAAEDVERSKENIKKMLAEAMRQSNEYVWVKKDGTRFPVLLTSTPIKKDDKVVGARGIIVDLTERKKMEKQLQDIERMAAIGQTAGMIGHDIRNPLQAIISELYLAKEDIAQAPEGKHKQESLESVNFMEEQVNYINKIVSDLQDFARPLNPEYMVVDLPDLLVSVFDAIVLPDKIELKVEVKDNIKFKTDPTFIRRAITNLVNNAVQAMPKGGELGLTVQKKEECAVITVSDTGQGIPEHVKANLFKPLTTTKAKGQGLGLAVVKRLVEALNGKVSFESEQGKGTKFTIELPA